MKDRNKYNKFMKEIINPAKFILDTLELSKKDLKQFKILNSTTDALNDIFKDIILAEGESRLSDTFKISKTTWSNISSNLSSRKLMDIKLNTIMGLGDKYEKVIINNINKLDNNNIMVLYDNKNKLNEINSEIRNVCSDKTTRKIIVDILKNLSVMILKVANNENLIDMTTRDNIEFNNKGTNRITDIVSEANELNSNKTKVNINIGEDLEEKFHKAISSYKSFSNKIIASMNDVDINILDDYDVTDMEFKRKSVLFKDGNSVSIKSATFRARFSSLMLSYVAKRMSKMTLVLSNEYDDKLMSSLSSLINMTVKYTTDVLTNKDANHYDMVKALMGSKGNNKSMNTSVQTLTKLDEFIGGLSSNLSFKESKVEKELQMNYVVKIAYMLTTINDNAKIDYPDDFNFRSKSDTLEVVKSLGHAINKTYIKEGKSNRVFTIFNDSKSKLFVKYHKDQLTDDVLTGCRALAFTEFILDDKRVNKVVKALVY